MLSIKDHWVLGMQRLLNSKALWACINYVQKKQTWIKNYDIFYKEESQA